MNIGWSKIPFIPFQTTGHEDYLMWLQILENTDSIGCNEVLAYYTVAGTIGFSAVIITLWYVF